MKRIISALLVLTLILSLAPFALAASDEANNAAQSLYELGLFQGTATNADGSPVFDLDRAPTRNEAVTMLVRLLGKEDEALNGTWNTPFIDVPLWAKPYVGYAYANGLTDGTSETTYSGDDYVSASQYITFVLRALGYTSGTDFQWNSAWELSDSIGLTSGEYNVNTTMFTHGDVAIVSYDALSVTLKGQSVTMLDSLNGNTNEPEDNDEPDVGTDYSYIAAADFRRIKRQYSQATPRIAYYMVYTNLDGDLCVLTYVYYSIISNFNEVTLHNITDGTYISNPERYYQERAERSYGNSALYYYDCLEEILTQHLNALESGNVVSAEQLGA